MHDSIWWPRYQRYLLSPAWKVLRTQVLQRDGYRCTSCGSRRRLEVHHLSYAHYNRTGGSSLEDCTTLCHPCHEQITARARRRRARFWRS